MRKLNRMLIGIGVNFLVIIPLLILPQLVYQGILSLAESFLIVESIIFILTFLLVRRIPSQGKKALKLKTGGLIFTMVSVIVLSLVYLTSVKTPPNWFLILIPVDVVILSVPVYLYYVNRKPPILSGVVISEEHTSVLREMFPESRELGHEVYLMNRRNIRNYATTTNGRNWKINLTSDAPAELSDGEIRMLLAETYINKKKGFVLKLVALGAALVALYIDLLIALPVLKDIYPSLSTMLLGVVIATFVLLFSLPFYVYALFLRSTIKTDRTVAERFGNSEDLKRVIRKVAELRLPPSTLSEGQLRRYTRRREKHMARRIDAIERVSNKGAGLS